MNKCSGFTLIELLIVVAIIAILAAIAVPNFLEAQTRSRVSRAKADLRTVATAVESYAVDHNTIPYDADDYPDFDPYNIAAWDQKAWGKILTTPISYLGAMPLDPFLVIKPEQARDASEIFAAQMTQLLFPGDPPFPYVYLTQSNYEQIQGKPTGYGITSVGPNRLFDSAARGGSDDLYDPTNGTISRGDVSHFGAGSR